MNEDLVIQKLVRLEADVAEIKEKIQKVDMFDDVLAGQDKIIQLLTKID